MDEPLEIRSVNNASDNRKIGTADICGYDRTAHQPGQKLPRDHCLRDCSPAGHVNQIGTKAVFLKKLCLLRHPNPRLNDGYRAKGNRNLFELCIGLKLGLRAMTVAGIVERFVVAHLEEHATQLDELTPDDAAWPPPAA